MSICLQSKRSRPLSYSRARSLVSPDTLLSSPNRGGGRDDRDGPDVLLSIVPVYLAQRLTSGSDERSAAEEPAALAAVTGSQSP
jgi:hypothetical protein